ncbi:MAG TPA: type II toxin-antitoxin system VapC family toxin [Acidimicrobiales bacterium]
MAVFVDTSALVKRYVAHPDRSLVIEAMAADDVWVASAVARTEVMLALHQLAPGRHSQARLWHAFRDDWDAFAVVPVDDRCLARAVELGARFSLHVVHAMHLAAADRLPRPLRYVTFDRRQIPTAAALGFDVVSPVAA